MQRVNTAYIIYYNLRHHRSGHLYQGRYKAKKLYLGVNQGYQGTIGPLSKLYSGQFSGNFRAYLSRIDGLLPKCIFR